VRGSGFRVQGSGFRNNNLNPEPRTLNPGLPKFPGSCDNGVQWPRMAGKKVFYGTDAVGG
jgi:hypothetical protein